MEQRPSERRIGARKAVIGLHCRWDLDGAGQKKRFLRRPAEQTAEITELSVSGATIVALSSDLLVPGTAVAIEIEGAKGGVAIRNLRPSSQAGMTCYGVEFLQLGNAIRARINEFVAADRPDHLEAVWHKAR
jgi:hypothetical protein